MTAFACPGQTAYHVSIDTCLSKKCPLMPALGSGLQTYSIGLARQAVSIGMKEKTARQAIPRCSNFSSLAIACRDQMASIAFPNISTGVYGFPRELAAEIAITVVKEFLSQQAWPMKVLFVCYDEENARLYQSRLG